MLARSARSMLLGAALAAGAVAAPSAHASCFTVYDARNTPVYQSTTAPIDLRGSISAQMARRFPQRFLVISDTPSCYEINVASATTGRNGSASNAAALLRGTPDADRFAGPYLDTSPAPQPAPGALPPAQVSGIDGDVYDGVIRSGNTIVVPQTAYGTQPAVPYGTPGTAAGAPEAPARVR